eukprot:Nitzschia sp. Nitz4//scaffold217_size45653//19694//20779//NITZ4_007223-RA/size45653-processed-gene-0.16-mRNA-1//1//CDS//3329542234//6593//frame0
MLSDSLLQTSILYNSSQALQTNATIDPISSEVAKGKPLMCLTDFNATNNGTESTFPIFPHMILVGAQKAGTTAINKALKLVPEFMEARELEPHFWDYRALPRLKRGNLTQTDLCELANKYASYWPKLKKGVAPSAVVYEKTPCLLAIPKAPWAIRTILDTIHPNHPVKILVLLRDPVRRFYSHYKMDFQNAGNTVRVEEVVKKEVRQLTKKGLLKAPRYYTGIPMDDKRDKMWKPSNFGTGTKVPDDYSSFLARGFYSKQLIWYMKYFTLGETLLVVRYEDFQEKPVETLEGIIKFLTGKEKTVRKKVRKALGRDLGPEINPHRNSYPMSNHTERFLRLLYKPFNDELADLLGESWRNVWD